ncbi:MAG: D-alanine--D-alanine ligase [Gemmatimonadota bacterium]|nr:D-alanine--D-alanine ligase [Gemmatimonadota bacterium]
MRKLRILLLAHPDLVPPDVVSALSPRESFEIKTEYDVISTLRKLGHDVHVLGVQWELRPVREAVDVLKPDIVFNLMEEFHGETVYDHNVVSFLELMKVPYTGCNPRGLMLSRGKALSKKLLAYHRIRVPEFAVFPMGRKVRRPKRLEFPVIVKSLIEHSSLGISRASVVDSDEKLAERVRMVHERIGTDAIAEQFITGRELYVSVLGNDRLVAFTPWELVAERGEPGEPLIATAKAKHDPDYQTKKGIVIQAVQQLHPEVEARLLHDSKRIYRILELSGYARVDFRVDAENRTYFLEANPNPDIAEHEEFASSAAFDGVPYPNLLERIIRLGLRQHE